MEKILVFSDSHGNVTNMIDVVEKEVPDMIIHLGDCWSDACILGDEYPTIPLEHVPGNCDGPHDALKKVIVIDNKKILICHGHTYNVKAGYLRLDLAARELGVDVALCGHTHSVYYNHHNGLQILNPGSIGAPAFGTPPSYGLLMIDRESGEITTDIVYFE